MFDVNVYYGPYIEFMEGAVRKVLTLAPLKLAKTGLALYRHEFGEVSLLNHAARHAEGKGIMECV